MKKILVGLDGSARASSVLGAAVSLARKHDAKLLLVRAITVPMELPAEAYSVRPNDLATLLEGDAQKALTELAKAVPAQHLDGTRVAIGVGWEVLCEIAKSADVDLIVLGSHGYRGLDHVIGTTAAKVVNHADRSVLVVRQAERI
jgi:nucleotide-binding universal stress UspA family protein